MHVKLTPHISRHALTKEPVDLKQYRVFVDGVLCGYMSYAPGSRAVLLERFDPADQAEINRQIGESERQSRATINNGTDGRSTTTRARDR